MAREKSSRTRFSWRTFLFGIVLLGFLFVAHDRFYAAFERLELIAYDLRINIVPVRPASGLIAIADLDWRLWDRSGHRVSGLVHQ